MSIPFFGAGALLTLASVIAVLTPQRKLGPDKWVAAPNWGAAAVLLWIAVGSVAFGALLSHMEFKWKGSSK